jgi:hypothetical protein
MSSEDFDGLKGKIWDEVWAHSRHLETMRSQYLGFFFTAVLAVTAIAAKELAGDGLRTTGSLIAFSALMLGLEVLAAFLLLAVKRIGRVLGDYRQSVFAIRDASRDRTAAWARLPGSADSYLGSTQGAAESVLYASLVVFLAALVGGAVRSHVIGGLTSGVCWAAFGLGLVAGVACIAKAGFPGRSSGGDLDAQTPGATLSGVRANGDPK